MWLPPTLVVTLGSTVQSPASCRSCRSLSGRMQSRCPCPSCEKARNADGTRADPAAATHGYHTSAPKHVPTPVTYALENGGDERLDGRVVQVLVSHPFIIHVVKPVCQKQRSHVIRRKVQVHSPHAAACPLSHTPERVALGVLGEVHLHLGFVHVQHGRAAEQGIHESPNHRVHDRIAPRTWRRTLAHPRRHAPPPASGKRPLRCGATHGAHSNHHRTTFLFRGRLRTMTRILGGSGNADMRVAREPASGNAECVGVCVGVHGC